MLIRLITPPWSFNIGKSSRVADYSHIGMSSMIGLYAKRLFLESLAATGFFLDQAASVFETASYTFDRMEEYLRKAWKDD